MLFTEDLDGFCRQSEPHLSDGMSPASPKDAGMAALILSVYLRARFVRFQGHFEAARSLADVAGDDLQVIALLLGDEAGNDKGGKDGKGEPRQGLGRHRQDLADLTEALQERNPRLAQALAEFLALEGAAKKSDAIAGGVVAHTLSTAVALAHHVGLDAAADTATASGKGIKESAGYGEEKGEGAVGASDVAAQSTLALILSGSPLAPPIAAVNSLKTFGGAGRRSTLQALKEPLSEAPEVGDRRKDLASVSGVTPSVSGSVSTTRPVAGVSLRGKGAISAAASVPAANFAGSVGSAGPVEGGLAVALGAGGVASYAGMGLPELARAQLEAQQRRGGGLGPATLLGNLAMDFLEVSRGTKIAHSVVKPSSACRLLAVHQPFRPLFFTRIAR